MTSHPDIVVAMETQASSTYGAWGNKGLEHLDIAGQLQDLGLEPAEIHHNVATEVLYELSLKYDVGTAISSTGALQVTIETTTIMPVVQSFIVEERDSVREVWWGGNYEILDEEVFLERREAAVSELNEESRLYVLDGFAGWDEEHRIPVRVISRCAHRALTMQCMLAPPSIDELEYFDLNAFPRPFTILDASSDRPKLERVKTSETSSTGDDEDKGPAHMTALALCSGQMLAVGKTGAEEMRHGLFIMMMYHMPLRPGPYSPPGERALPMMSACNVGPGGDVALFIGLDGTGKTSLSASSDREILGDAGHVWTEFGVCSFEAGCCEAYSTLSCEEVSAEDRRIRFGAVVERRVQNDTDNSSFSSDDEKASSMEPVRDCFVRMTYPLHHVANARVPGSFESHPSNVIILAFDVHGVLPLVSKLSDDAVVYHFLSGYSAIVPNDNFGFGETQAEATFSPCFAGPVLARHPFSYAEMLKAKLALHHSRGWLVNTGWHGGPQGVGKQCSMDFSRRVVEAIHDGTLAAIDDSSWEDMGVLGLHMPRVDINGVSRRALRPIDAWEANGASALDYRRALADLAIMFQQNFRKYESDAPHQSRQKICKNKPKTSTNYKAFKCQLHE